MHKIAKINEMAEVAGEKRRVENLIESQGSKKGHIFSKLFQKIAFRTLVKVIK